MNITHLGDALDHWEGSVIERLRNKLKDLRVVPMLTDAQRWTRQHFEVYASLLNVGVDEILLQEFTFSKEGRRRYFRNVGEHDLFLDPDTGISIGCCCNQRHIRLSDIDVLVGSQPKRLLLIYQHSRRDSQYALATLNVIHRSLRSTHLFAYYAGTVSMVFISGDRGRIDLMRAAVASFLGPVAKWHHTVDAPARVIEPNSL